MLKFPYIFTMHIKSKLPNTFNAVLKIEIYLFWRKKIHANYLKVILSQYFLNIAINGFMLEILQSAGIEKSTIENILN